MVYQSHITDAQEILSDEEIIALMPKNFTFIAELIGVSFALQLIEAYAGTSIFIPSKFTLNLQNDISGVIGLKNLRLLAEHMGGEKIEVPMGTAITTHMRNRLIQNALDKGDSQPKIARKFGVTPRTVRTARNSKIKPIEPDQNLDLFK